MPDPGSPAADAPPFAPDQFEGDGPPPPVRYAGQGGAAEDFVRSAPPPEFFQERPAPRRAGRGVSPWLVLVLLVIIGGLLFRLGLLSVAGVFAPGAEPRAVTPRGALAPAELTTAEIFKTASPSVVHITGIIPGEPARDSFGRFGLLPGKQVAGSGFVWNERGHVVTNAHVVRDAEELRVTLSDGSTYEARKVGSLDARDIAVIKINAPPGELVPILVGESGDLRVGQQTFAIGSPFGLDQTLTTGVVSGLDRAIPAGEGAETPVGPEPPPRITGAIQTDAAINVGNSGGPLLDSAGRLIGMNTAIYSETGQSSGIGFAVPVDDVNRFVPDLIDDGEVRQVGLGVGLASDAAMRLYVTRGLLPRTGALVRIVIPGTAADRAGLRGARPTGARQMLGDLIVAVDGRRVESGEDLKDLLTRMEAGGTVELTVRRFGSEEPLTVSAALQELTGLNPAGTP